MPASVHDVAAFILERSDGPMSTMKLQKLVYYSQAWHLVWDDEPLFLEQIQAWANGPVVYELFNVHRGQYTVSTWPAGDSKRLTNAQRATINTVLQSYGHLDGRKLSELTHNEDPWMDARAGLSPTDRSSREITQTALADYYSAVAAAASAMAVEDVDWSAWDDVDLEEDGFVPEWDPEEQ